ncbi:hypothetical protein ACLKA7_014254 [Drosophila subpalustris]
MTEFPKCCSEDSLYEFEQNERRRLTDAAKSSSKRAHFKSKPQSKPESKPQPKLKHADQQHFQQWQEHRHRVKNMDCNVDCRAPAFQAARQTGVNGLYPNAVAFMERTKKNIQMLVELSKIIRTHGVINPFRSDRVYTSSCLPYTINKLERIDEENLDIAKRILDVVSELDTGLKSKSKSKKCRRGQKLKPFTMNEEPLAKYRGYNIEMPQTDKERWRLFRPHIYFDIYLKDSRPLGRIVVELYTEAAPVVVLELVRACSSNQHKNFVIRRLFPDLWLNVECNAMSGNSELFKPLEYDAKVIDHGASSYVLSFSKDYLQGFRNHLSFSLSFKPLSVANGSRVGFGRVIKNSKIFDSLQSYGTKNGVLRRSITFTGCGIV